MTNLHSLPVELTHYIYDFIQLPKDKVKFSLIDTYHYRNIYPLAKYYTRYSCSIQEISKIKYLHDYVSYDDEDKYLVNSFEYNISGRRIRDEFIYSILYSNRLLSIFRKTEDKSHFYGFFVTFDENIRYMPQCCGWEADRLMYPHSRLAN